MKRALLAAALAAGAGCARPKPVPPPEPPAAASGVRYYSDLGPSTIDVSGYPAKQRREYERFEQTCSQCHTLARAVNAPAVGRQYWEMYILGMRFRTGVRPANVTQRELDELADFLEFDNEERKVRRREEFDRLTDELKRRYEELQRP